MPVAEEVADPWLEEVSSESPSGTTARWEDNFVKIYPTSQLDVKILEIGDSPRVMTDIVDGQGNLLVRKYDLLTKAVWQRLRNRPDAPHLYFVCEHPIRVVETFNMEFFNYEDYQFLGAYLAEKGKQKSAGQLFAEAVRSETADAHINKGVFHFRSGAQGVFDNYRLAKKHFERGLILLHRANLLPAELKKRRRICDGAVDEIAFHMSFGLVKWFKILMRLVTLRMDPDVFYVGPADKKILRDSASLKAIVDTIAGYELQMFKEAMENFIYTLKLNVPEGHADLGLAIDGLANQAHAAHAEREMIEHLNALGGIYLRISAGRVRVDQEKEVARQAAARSLLEDLSTEQNAQIKRLDTVYCLKSPRELADIAARKDIDGITALWLYRERSNIRMIMDALYRNSAVAGEIKTEMERLHGFGKRRENGDGG